MLNSCFANEKKKKNMNIQRVWYRVFMRTEAAHPSSDRNALPFAE